MDDKITGYFKTTSIEQIVTFNHIFQRIGKRNRIVFGAKYSSLTNIKATPTKLIRLDPTKQILYPPTPVVITGTEAAMASMMETGVPSFNDVSARIFRSA